MGSQFSLQSLPSPLKFWVVFPCDNQFFLLEDRNNSPKKHSDNGSIYADLILRLSIEPIWVGHVHRHRGCCSIGWRVGSSQPRGEERSRDDCYRRCRGS
jgi:hypothetical protein